MRVISRFAIVIHVLTAFAFGQAPEDSWANLKRLKAGQTVQIVDMKLKSTKGDFLAFSEDTVSIRQGVQELVFKRGDVYRITLQQRLKKALIAGSIGAGVGFALGAVVDYLDDVDSTDPGSNYGKLSATGVGFGIGFGVGAAFPGQQTIYRSKPTN
jgi:putative component of toxin-antitoxin plasmid stabilization module